jgi:hypothetical protein
VVENPSARPYTLLATDSEGAKVAPVITPQGFPRVQGNRKIADVLVACDDAYQTGGYAVAASDVGLSEILHMDPTTHEGYDFEYDLATGKLKASYSDLSGSSDGPKVEVADEADLETLAAVPCRFEGY